MLRKFIAFLISSPLILYVITLFIGNKTDFINFIFSTYTSIKEFIIKVLSYKIHFGSIIIFCLVCSLIFYFLKKILNNTPDWYYSFRHMEYNGNFFSWNYYIPYKGQFTVVDIKPVCSCKCGLVTHFIQLKCPVCKKVYNKPEEKTVEELQKIIIYKIENNEI